MLRSGDQGYAQDDFDHCLQFGPGVGQRGTGRRPLRHPAEHRRAQGQRAVGWRRPGEPCGRGGWDPGDRPLGVRGSAGHDRGGGLRGARLHSCERRRRRHHRSRAPDGCGRYFPSGFEPACAPGRDHKEADRPTGIEELFTSRQAAVADALRRGKANKTIAYELNMCESTVKVHIRTIMKKLAPAIGRRRRSS